MIASYSGKGTIVDISKLVEYEDGTKVLYLTIKVSDTQQLMFYCTKTSKTKQAFDVIKHFEFKTMNIGDQIEFDFNILDSKKGGYKMKIWKIYNHKRTEV